MVITLDLGGLSFNECPQWYRNIVHKANNIGANIRRFEDVVGFDVKLTNYSFTIRKLTGEETEITAMILKWS